MKSEGSTHAQAPARPDVALTVASPYRDHAGPRTAIILDVDGVLLRSPHERAWRDALAGFADPVRFTPALYRSEVAGKPRLDGALAALLVLGVRDASERAADYAARKQARLEALIAEGRVEAFPDALRLVLALRTRGIPMAAASSSRNATAMMRDIRLDDGETLLDALTADVSGSPVSHGKPDPDLFLVAAEALKARPCHCIVIEDAVAGIEAARRGQMRVIGLARSGEVDQLAAAGADVVVESLDDIDVRALANGQLEWLSA